MQARSWLSSRLKKVACHLFSACSEATETGKEKGIRVWHAMSRTVNNINSSFLYGFYLIFVSFKLKLSIPIQYDTVSNIKHSLSG